MKNDRLQIFISASSELRVDRDVSSLLIFDLSEHGRGENSPALYPMRREEMDKATSRRRNNACHDEISRSEIFVGLFWKKLDSYTQEELNHALQRNTAGELPREIVLFIKKTADINVEEVEKQLVAELNLSKKKLDLRYYENEEKLKYELLHYLFPYLRSKYDYLEASFEMSGEFLYINNEIEIDTSQLSASHQILIQSLTEL